MIAEVNILQLLCGETIVEKPESTAESIVSEVLSGGRLRSIIRSFQLDPKGATSTDSFAKDGLIAIGTTNEQQLRDRLCAMVLLVAYYFSIDSTRLPQVVAEHVGISDQVDLEEMQASLRNASWQPRGRIRILSAECSHQAVDLALREYAGTVASVLHEIHASVGEIGSLRPLEDLPTHVAADEVRAAVELVGTRAYDGQGFRFRLADDRIQELLMGAQLYGEPTLAVRELYQNALDACRYRLARNEYLAIARGDQRQWNGRISFRQGYDDRGRLFLECEDNGVGMGERELRDVFSNAGVRFADLPEYVDEASDWKKVGIELHPNSTFGVGVLSYFMIAEEMIVTTSRFFRDGSNGPLLRVSIPGPGALSRIQKIGVTRAPGTTVRLILRTDAESISCVRLLTELLWLSEFDVEASDHSGFHEWRPGVLSQIATVGKNGDSFPAVVDRKPPAVIKPTESKDAWFCDGSGAILADGIWAGESVYGFIYNLCDELSAKLTVDRRTIVDNRMDDIERVLVKHVAEIADGGLGDDTHEWLANMAHTHPKMVDAMAAEITAQPVSRWKVAGSEVCLASAGIYPPDRELFRYALERQENLNLARELARPSEASLSLIELEWRFLTWIEAGLVQGFELAADVELIRAVPSDMFLNPFLYNERIIPSSMSAFRRSRSMDYDFEQEVDSVTVYRMADRLSRDPAAVADRLRVLGYRVVDTRWLDIRKSDIKLLSLDLDAAPPFLNPLASVDTHHVVRAAASLDMEVQEVVSRFTLLGFRVNQQIDWSKFSREDYALLALGKLMNPRLMSNGRNYSIPARGGELVSYAIWVSRNSDRSVKDVVAAMVRLGLSVPRFNHENLLVDDAHLVSEGGDIGNYRSFIDYEESVFPLTVLQNAHQRSVSPGFVADRLREIGYSVPDLDWEALSSSNFFKLILNSQVVPDLYPRVLRARTELAIGEVCLLAASLNSSYADAAENLRYLGLAIPNFDWSIVEKDDLMILSRDLDSRLPVFDPDDGECSFARVIEVAAKLGRTQGYVAGRYTTFGYSVTAHDWPESGVDDVRILSRDYSGEEPYLDPAKDDVTVQHVLGVAATTGRRPSDISEQLKAYGFCVPDREWPQVTPDDSRLLRNLVVHPQAEPTGRSAVVRAGTVLGLSTVLARTTADIARRLRELGFDLDERIVFRGTDTAALSP